MMMIICLQITPYYIVSKLKSESTVAVLCRTVFNCFTVLNLSRIELHSDYRVQLTTSISVKFPMANETLGNLYWELAQWPTERWRSYLIGAIWSIVRIVLSN